MIELRNKKFEIILKEIGYIINNIISCEITILLIGSYGRGDGKFDKKGHPLRDIDLAIILEKNEKINESEIKIKLKESNLLSNLIIDLHYYTFNSLIRVLPFWRFYDLRHNSKIILGPDIRDKICNFKSSDISKYDGLRMLAGEIIKIFRENKISKNKLYYIMQSAKNIKAGIYGTKVDYQNHKISMDEFVDYSLRYYSGGYKKCPFSHLQPTIYYLLKNRCYITLKKTAVFSFFIQIYWTISWAIKTKNIKVLYDWRDPAIRIIYSIFYNNSKKIKNKTKYTLFEKVKFPGMKYSRQNLLKLYERYFLSNKWRFFRKSNWKSNSQVIIE